MLDLPELLPEFESFYAHEYSQALEIKNLQSQALWDTYKMYGQNETREMKLLRARFSAIRDFFNRVIPKAGKNDQATKVQKDTQSVTAQLQN